MAGWSSPNLAPWDPSHGIGTKKPFDFNPWATGIGSVIGGGLGSMSGKDPSDVAMPYFNNAGQAITEGGKNARETLNPYNQGGLYGLNHYQGMIDEYSNPQEFYNKIMSGFNLTPAQQAQQQAGLDAVSHNNATRGLLGSPTHANQIQDFATNNTAQAQQQYFNNIMGISNEALHGYGDMYHTGQGAGEHIANTYMDEAQRQAELEEAKAQMMAAQQASRNRGASSIGGGLGGIVGAAAKHFLF